MFRYDFLSLTCGDGKYSSENSWESSFTCINIFYDKAVLIQPVNTCIRKYCNLRSSSGSDMRILKFGTGYFLNTRIQQNNCSFKSVSQISMEICKRLKARYCLLLLQDIHASSGTNPIILHVHVQCTCTHSCAHSIVHMTQEQNISLHSLLTTLN